MAIAERAEAYLWSNIDLHNANLLVWEHEPHGLALRVCQHVDSIQSQTHVISITGGDQQTDPIKKLSTLGDQSLDCAVIAFKTGSLSFTRLLTLFHKVHLLLRPNGRLIVRMDSLRAAPSPELRWWERRNRLAKAAASLAGEGHGADLTSEELVAMLQVIGFYAIQPMVFHGEPLNSSAITSLVEEVTRHCARMETPNWRQAITDELKRLRQQLETERGYAAPVAIIDATKQAKQ